MKHWKSLLAVCFILPAASPGWSAPPKPAAKPEARPPINRFVWQAHRIRTAGAIDGRVTISRRTVLLKCDTATGKTWRYRVAEEAPEEPEEGEELKTFIRIPIEELETDKPPEKDAKDKPPPRPQVGRYQLVSIGVPAIIKLDSGKEGLGEKTELLLVDSRRGRNWVYSSDIEWVEGKGHVTEMFRRLKGEDDEIIEEVAVKVSPPKKADSKEEKKKSGKKPEVKPAAKEVALRKSDDDWRAFFMAHHVGNEFQTSSKWKVACVVVLDKTPNAMTPWVIFRDGWRDKPKMVTATPWEITLYSDDAVNHLCEKAAVPLADAGRLAIYISDRGTAKGFRAFPAVLLTEVPGREKASQPTRTE